MPASSPSDPVREQSSPATRWAWALNLLVLLPVLPLLLQQGFVVQHDISMSDLLHSHLPYRAALGRIIADGHLPLWLPDVFSGTPLWAQIEAGAAFPLHVVAFAALDPYSAMNLCNVLEILLATFGAWLLARRMGIDARHAVLAGLAYGWCGFMVTHLRHPNMHAAAALLPWIMWATERVLARRPGSGPLLAALIALQISAGHPQITWLSLLLLGARVATHWHGGWRAWIHRVAIVGAASALGAALLAVLLVPTWAFTHAAMGEVSFDWAYATAYPLPPGELLGMVWPSWVGSMEGYDYRGHAGLPWGNYGYVGIITIVMAVIGAWTGRRRTAIRLFTGVLVLATILALGDATPLFEAAWLALPGTKLFRFANRFLLISQLALAVLAAAGLSWLAHRLARRSSRIAAWLPLLVLSLVMLDLDHHHSTRMPVDARNHWDNPAQVRSTIGAIGERGRTYTLDELALWERAFHAAQGFRKGFEPYRALWEVPLCSSGILIGLQSASGYTRMLHHRSAAFWQIYERPSSYPRYHPTEWGTEPGRLNPRLRGLLDRGNVKLVFSSVPLHEPGLTRLGTATLHVYENEDALPRAYLTESWQPVDDLAGAARWMFQDGLASPAVPCLEGAGPVPDGDSATPRALTVADNGPNHLSITLPAGHRGGLVVLTDSWDEGWTATLDGEAAPLLPTNGYQRGMLVPPEAGELTMTYRPVGWRLGLFVSFVALATLLAWVLASCLARRRQGTLEASAGS